MTDSSHASNLPLERLLRLIAGALADPGSSCRRLTSWPPHTRQMEPLERWQARAALSALHISDWTAGGEPVPVPVSGVTVTPISETDLNATISRLSAATAPYFRTGGPLMPVPPTLSERKAQRPQPR